MPGACRVVGQQPAGCASGNPTAAQRAMISRDITNNLYTTDVGIRRDTASVAFRWTPETAWDVHVDYSHMHRWGTQVEGVVFSPGTSGVVAQVPKPVDDTTQNFGINGEYKGTSPWGKILHLQARLCRLDLSGRLELLHGRKSILRRRFGTRRMRAQRLAFQSARADDAVA